MILQEALDLLITARRLSAKSLLSRALLSLCEGQDRPVVGLNQEDLAELVGVSRVTISKALKLLEQKGVLERRYKQIVIIDVEALRRNRKD